MDISLSKTQKNIAKEARRFLTKECPFDYVREMYEDDRGFTDDIWEKMAEMDWMAMRIPESYGGLGMEQIDINMVLEEMGRAVVPSPFFSTIMLAAETIIEAGNDSQKKLYLSKIADGNLKGTLALHEIDSGGDLEYIHMEASTKADEFVLNGTKVFVPDAHVADFIICAARTSDGDDKSKGITLFLIDTDTTGVTTSLLPTMDGSRKLCIVDFKNVKTASTSILGDLHNGWKPLKRVLQRAQTGLSAECVGGAQRAMEIATDFAKVRIQYNQPIGAFQAIKHHCAKMYVAMESARSIVYYSAWAQDHGDEKEAAIAASAAKSYCSEAFTNVATNGIQVLGATGFTMENEMNLFLKRAKANELALGDPEYHRENVMRLVTS